jgi:hypothetical protein
MSKFELQVILRAMSHFEINKAVAEKLGFTVEKHSMMDVGKVFVIVDIDQLSGRGNVSYRKIPDYCKSWADAGPVIEKYQISLIKDISCGDWEAAEALEFIHGSIDSGNYKKNKSPLVAAMLVFLDMEVV